MRIEVLGPIRAQADGTEIVLGGSQQRLVLALLAEAGGRVVTTDQLMDRVWGDRLPANARKTIQVHVSKLRRVLASGDAIETVGGGYRLSSEVEIDSQTFERLLAEGRQHLQDRPEHAANLLNDALALWSGPAFADLCDEEALQTEIRRLEELRLSAVEDRIAADVAVGELGGAIAELGGMVERYPLRERLLGLLMTALYRAGRHTEALGAYGKYRHRLAEESGLDPSPELQDLELRILNHEAGLTTATAPSSRQPATTGLPARYASFVGREREVAEGADRIASQRLMTIVGSGGIGKSSLAIEVLRRGEAQLGLPIVRIPVETSDEPRLRWMVAAALGLEPEQETSPEEAIIGYLRSRPHLLMFDGCEPVIDEAASLAHSLLSHCPSLRIVATSRQPLGLAGESVLHIGPLGDNEALLLLADRAGLELAKLDDDTVDKLATVCAAVDGIPLAIELAAARHRATPLDSLLQRLDDQVRLLQPGRSRGRHGSLAAAMNWSYDLLDDDHQRALRALSVFRYDFDLEAATDVLALPDTSGILASLIDTSFVERADDDGFHRILEPIRQYAAHLLESAGESAATERRRAQGLARRCRHTFLELASPRRRAASRWIVRNRFEIAAVLEWCVAADEPDLAADIIAHVGGGIWNSGFASLIIPSAVSAVDHEAATPSPNLALAIAQTAWIVSDDESELDRAEASMARAEAMAQDLGDPEVLGRILLRKQGFLGDAYDRADDELRRLGERAIALLQSAGASDWGAWLHNIAVNSLHAGDLDQLEEDALELRQWEDTTLGHRTGWSVGLFAELAEHRGDLETAIGLYRESALLLEEDQLWHHARWRWVGAAMVWCYMERGEQADEALRRADALGTLMGADPDQLFAVRARISSVLGRHTEACETAAKWFENIATRGGPNRFELYGRGSSPGRFLPILLSLATAWAETGQFDQACRFAIAAAGLCAASDYDHWDEIGETARWQRVASQCTGLPAPPNMTLEQAHAEASSLVASRT